MRIWNVFKSRSLPFYFLFLIGSSVALPFSAKECGAYLQVLSEEYTRRGTFPHFNHPSGQGTMGLPAFTIYPGTVDKLVQGRFFDFAHTTWYDPNAIYIGVANHPTEGTFHFYLVAGNLRLDGKLGPTTVREGKAGQPPLATDGILFKIGSSPRLRAAVQRSIGEMRDRPFNNCVEPVREIFRQVGIDVEATQPGTHFASPQALVGNLFLGELRYQGEALRVGLLAASDAKLKDFLSRAYRIDAHAAPLLTRQVH